MAVGTRAKTMARMGISRIRDQMVTFDLCLNWLIVDSYVQLLTKLRFVNALPEENSGIRFTEYYIEPPF
jgi:hypothetical protein